MTLLGLAFNSLRFRRGSFAATFINVFLGAVVLMSFASLFDTAGGVGVSSADASSLTTIAAAVGGWGLVIVGFGVASTMNLSVRQRQAELALLKATGAMPSQIGRIIVGEGAAISIMAALLGIVPAWLIGRVVLDALTSTDQIADDVSYRFGPLALIAGLSTTLLATAGATTISARAAGRVTAREALSQAATDGRSIGRGRIIAGGLLLVVGISCALTTATVLKDEGFTTLSVAGQACIASAIGLALLSPLVLRGLIRSVELVTRPLTGAAGYLATTAIRQRTGQATAITMPVIILTGLAAGTLYIQKIQNAANAADGITVSADDKGVETLNFIIVGMIALFAAIVLINNCVASLLARRQEFGLTRKLGATPGQILRAVAFETMFAAASGLALGTISAAIGIAGFQYGRTGSLRLDLDAVPYLAIVGTVVVLAITASLTAARRSLAAPMIDAAGVART
ncbi:ABC transporter permease [Plantactinospora soyae]|uniref:ABC transport system permease protein n=1 Tax=Plantactinospora soyae TaxID=1544732 RepID=A0A927R7L2_9ACTN|nr:FtsX-like permease family protein [Plantactinospora soyae]MBE1489554.1 putative ABC transport system permease protein [Plantactinospora soyae]